MEVTFCTYFKNIVRFRYEYEIYGEYVAFCVKRGSFFYQIDDHKGENVSEGQIVICPPECRFSRAVTEPVELCMIKFRITEPLPLLGKPINITNLLRFHDDLQRLEECLFCDRLSEEPVFLHYCMDILYLSMDSIGKSGKLAVAKKYIEQNYDKEIEIGNLAKQIGYSTPHFINKFKLYYGLTPKAFVTQVKILRGKELLMTTDLLSREIAYSLGFTDELYFIRLFKKHTGLTPKQFRAHHL